jgi:hypothetical protein
MAFEFCDSYTEQYHRDGYTVFPKILPPSLISDLRREVERGLKIARQKGGPNAQRLQPISNHPELEQKPFQDYCELPALVDAVKQIIGPEAWIGGPLRMGVLYEPAERPWATAWHPDFGPLQKRMDPAMFARMRTDFRYFHQVNCALYEDNCTWYVPGSHHRADFADEVPLARDYPWQIGMDQETLSIEELERFCLAYVQSMPRAIRLHLDAGDFGLYRNHGFHLGFYVPYKKRATLHDSVWTPQWKAAFERWGAGGPMELTPEAAPAAK